MHVAASVTYFDPQPAPDELPARMPSPFSQGHPHPLAARAAAELRRDLDAGLADQLGIARDGKMFGVLVVADRDGRIGYLRAFSGMVGRTWQVPGFVGPAFDQAARDAFWIAGEGELVEIALAMARVDARAEPLRAELAALQARHAGERTVLRARHREAKTKRHALRATTHDAAVVEALNRESARHASERQQLEQQHAAVERELAARITALDAERDAHDAERTARSRSFLVRIHETYAFANARGDARSLRALFAPAEPPGGAGDCAAPKLLAHAYRERLTPLVLAELWCGAPPATGDRRDGQFYAACRGKCGPILAHMLEGASAEPHPVFGEDAVAADEPRTLYEDRWLAVILKPAGLLSVPGRSSKADSVLARLRRRYPDATGPLLPHRLDLDTSGLMVVAKDLATHGALQRQFAERTLTKRYVAILDGEPREESGVIDLPLRVDVDDRPRQIVDRVHGRAATTEWQVLARERNAHGVRTRVALWPKTGRTHQLRVHAAHPLGIGVPIVGDRLYGRPDHRLLLHAEALCFVHPHEMEQRMFEHAAPF